MAPSQRTLLQEAKQLRELAAGIRAGIASDQAAEPLTRPAGRRSPRQPPAAASVERDGGRGLSFAQARPAGTALGEPARLAVGLITLETTTPCTSAADTTARVALVSRCQTVRLTRPRGRELAAGDWLVLENAEVAGADTALAVEVWSRSASEHILLGSLLVDCGGVSSGQGNIDSWFRIADRRGDTAAQVLLAVEQHVPSAAPREVASLPSGWGERPAVDTAERVSEVAERIQQRLRRQSKERQVNATPRTTDRAKTSRGIKSPQPTAGQAQAKSAQAHRASKQPGSSSPTQRQKQKQKQKQKQQQLSAAAAVARLLPPRRCRPRHQDAGGSGSSRF